MALPPDDAPAGRVRVLEHLLDADDKVLVLAVHRGVADAVWRELDHGISVTLTIGPRVTDLRGVGVVWAHDVVVHPRPAQPQPPSRPSPPPT